MSWLTLRISFDLPFSEAFGSPIANRLVLIAWTHYYNYNNNNNKPTNQPKLANNPTNQTKQATTH